MVGLPGTGKSTFARALARETGAVVVESDRFRRLLFRTPSFSTRENAALFQALAGATARLLDKGQAVVIDATNLSERDRRPFYVLAESKGLPQFVVALEAPEALVEERLARRLTAEHGYACADSTVYHRMKGRVEPISRGHLRLDTSDGAAVEAALAAVVAAYRDPAGRFRFVGTAGQRGTSS
jgi:predicted kinase